jgi:DNA-binding phage protein
MPLTRDFRETVMARAQCDPEFREGLLNEGVAALLRGELEVGKDLLRDYINAAVGFEELGRLTGKSSKSLMRMFGPNGNPQARNLFEVISQLQRHEGVRLEVTAVR